MFIIFTWLDPVLHPLLFTPEQLTKAGSNMQPGGLVPLTFVSTNFKWRSRSTLTSSPSPASWEPESIPLPLSSNLQESSSSSLWADYFDWYFAEEIRSEKNLLILPRQAAILPTLVPEVPPPFLLQWMHFLCPSVRPPLACALDPVRLGLCYL